MSVQKQISPHFDVQVKVNYVESESRPEAGYHFFAYKVIIQNKGQASAQLMSRHWVITDGFGQVEEVRGAGVIGMQPKIAAGQSFEYESACPLTTTSGTMRGTYQMLDDAGNQFDIEVPEFYLIAPSALH
jgi:ApaG protein